MMLKISITVVIEIVEHRRDQTTHKKIQRRKLKKRSNGTSDGRRSPRYKKPILENRDKRYRRTSKYYLQETKQHLVCKSCVIKLQ